LALALHRRSPGVVDADELLDAANGVWLEVDVEPRP
jgi:hypothetical protein